MPDFYRRHLPHWHPPEAQFFITFRLAGSLPREVIAEVERELAAARTRNNSPEVLTREQHRFALYERYLESAPQGPTWLAQPAVAGVVRAEMHRLDGQRYTLLAYCIMPNHVHLLIDTVGFASGQTPTTSVSFLTETLRLLKGRSARFANQYLKRRGAFWQSESFDHVVRSPESLLRIVRYIAYNPVRAGLVNQWRHWPFTWVQPELIEAAGLDMENKQ
ncbi:MAG: transposase [Caldilineae bacterium]|nr:MAG: transposase [Caldilineae bacterium]